MQPEILLQDQTNFVVIDLQLNSIYLNKDELDRFLYKHL